MPRLGEPSVSISDDSIYTFIINVTSCWIPNSEKHRTQLQNDCNCALCFSNILRKSKLKHNIKYLRFTCIPTKFQIIQSILVECS